MTNGDRIRAMTDTELARYMNLTCRECVFEPFAPDGMDCVSNGFDCIEGRAKWLGQEACNGETET